MPQSVFDLGGELTVDTTQLKSISEQVETELGKVSAQEAKAKVSVDDSEAKSKVKSMGKDVADLGSAIEKKRTITVDTAQAKDDWISCATRPTRPGPGWAMSKPAGEASASTSAATRHGHRRDDALRWTRRCGPDSRGSHQERLCRRPH
jgi:hypothetical protein